MRFATNVVDLYSYISVPRYIAGLYVNFRITEV
jgi:hypothetical protein